MEKITDTEKQKIKEREIIQAIESTQFKTFVLYWLRNYPSAKELYEDVRQEVAYRALIKIDYYRRDTKPLNWVIVLAKNHLINIYHRKRKSPVINYETYDGLEHLAVDQSSGLSMLYVAQLQKYIDALEPKYNLPFMMVTNGMSYEEIAGVMKLPLGTIKSRIHTARGIIIFQLKPEVLKPRYKRIIQNYLHRLSLKAHKINEIG